MSFAADVDSCLLVAERAALEAAAKSANFVFSPLSLRAALSLAAAGAAGESQREMLSFLGSPTVELLNTAAARLMAPVLPDNHRNDGEPCVSFVNGVRVDRLFSLSSPFQALAADVYGAVAESVDFSYHPTEQAKEVNASVHENTNGLIKDIFPPISECPQTGIVLAPLDSVGPQTRIVLTNALCFKSMWLDKFDTGETREARFHLLDKRSTVQVPFMVSMGSRFISYFQGFKVLKLPCRQYLRFSMLIVLPDEVDGLADVMHKVSSVPNFLEKHTPRKRVPVRNFMVPKFRIEYKFEASNVMDYLGVKDPFGKGVQPADFTPMASNLTAPAEGMFISGVHHKAVIEVNEGGIFAAAAGTGMVMASLCFSPPNDFVADHPFVFAVVDEESGGVLFLGHVVNPGENLECAGVLSFLIKAIKKFVRRIFQNNK